MMHTNLYFVCSTNYLEVPINRSNKTKCNYFYTSLGNSVEFDLKTTNQIINLIRKYNIDEISFVLSNENSIILDALSHQKHYNIRGLSVPYDNIYKQKEQSQFFFETAHSSSVLSYYLNHRIKKLHLELRKSNIGPIKINEKIYDKQINKFITIYSDLLCLEKYKLN